MSAVLTWRRPSRTSTALNASARGARPGPRHAAREPAGPDGSLDIRLDGGAAAGGAGSGPDGGLRPEARDGRSRGGLHGPRRRRRGSDA